MEKSKGKITGILYVNDTRRTIDTIKDYDFKSSTLSELKKEIKKMAKDLQKENDEYWYQGQVIIDGVKYNIEYDEIEIREE